MLLPLFVVGQQKYQLFYEKEGDSAVKDGEYTLAFDNYKLALKFFRAPSRLYYKCGYACQLDKDYEKAVVFYKKTIENTPYKVIADSFPLLYFNLAQVDISSGYYFVANSYLDSVLAQSKDAKILSMASHQKESIAWVLKNNKLRNHIEVNNLGGNVNDFLSQSPNSLGGDSVLYLTTMTYNRMDTKQSKQILYNNIYNQIYFSRIDSLSGFSQSKPFDINQKQSNISNLFYDNKTKDIYFNNCQNSQNEGCKIFVSHYLQGKYEKPLALNEKINQANTSSLHPQIVYYKGKKILFFSSNRKGGFGGYDIYYSILEDGKENPATNLGSTINTQGDEITPFYDTITNTLFFSSDWHYGFGGFDIFASCGNIHKWEEPHNLLQPINSPANETHYIPHSYYKGNTRFCAFFSSNREGGFTKENKTCCNDIYLAIDNTPPPIYLLKTDTISSAQCFFSNDMPEDSATSYSDCYEKYLVLKEDYKAQNTQTDSLFSYLIEKGKKNVDSLFATILDQLKQGHTITLTLNGYTSALHTQEYNMALSERRIQSIILYINEWNNKVLAKYLFSSLKIKTNPMGKSQSHSANPTSAKEREKSIFTPLSISERKVSIIATNDYIQTIQN